MSLHKIKEYNRAYRAGTPIISDQSYDDKLEAFLKEKGLKAEHIKDLIMEEMGEVPHETVIGSLKKLKYEEPDEIDSWLKGDTLVSSKIDGMSMVLKYEDGILIGAVTRGNGEKGVDQFEKVKHIVNDFEGYSGEVRGELTLTFESLEELRLLDPGCDHANTRNSTIGIINSKSSSIKKIKLVKFIAYEMVCSDLSRLNQLKELSAWGFEIPEYEILHKSLDSVRILKDMLGDFMENAEYLVDGLVLCDIDWCGENDKYYPLRARAFKMNTENEITEVVGIEYNVGKTGKIIPVVLLDPVSLNGTTVKRAAGHNFANIRDQHIVIGTQVRVQKSGDIIPFITEIVDTDFDEPIVQPKCPECGGESSIVNDTHWVCSEGDHCKGVTTAKVESFLVRGGVKGIAYNTLYAFKIHSIDDLLNFKPDPSKKKQMTLMAELEKKVFTRNTAELIKMLTWNQAGTKIVQKILNVVPPMEFFSKIKDNDFTTYPMGIGKTTIENMQKSLDQNLLDFAAIMFDDRYCPITAIKETPEETITKNDNPLRVTVTGTFDKPRKEIEAIIKKAGHTVAPLSGKSDYLVVGGKPGPAKLAKCEKLGVKVIDGPEFLKTYT